jgi:hypothetical protein
VAEFDAKHLCGWAGPELAREAFDLWGENFAEFRVVGESEPKPDRVMLFDYTRKLLGKDVPNIAQLCGDCVSWGCRNALAYVQALPILNGAALDWTDVFPPYLYGTGRVQIGGTRLGLMDGSTGGWGAAAALKHGAIPMQGEGIPKYSASVARQWGRGSGPPAKFLEWGQRHLARTVARVNSVDEAITAVKNGYPVTLASSYGFQMKAGASGYHEYATRWDHQMCLVGVDTGGSRPCGALLNSWGDLHGRVRDEVGEWPLGMLRVRLDVIDAMIRQQDSYIWSSFDGFPAQKLPRSAFDLW